MLKLDANKVRGAVFAVAMLGMLLALVLSGCGAGKGSHEDKRGRGDVPTGEKDYTPPRIVNNADTYPNISVKCDGKYGYLIFTTTHQINDVPPVITPDPRCPGWRPDLVAPGQPQSGAKPGDSGD